MFNRLILLIRDSCHALKIAMKEPLHHDELFGKVWEELFDKKKAVVLGFQYSDKLKALLVVAQKEGADPLGLPGHPQPLAVVLECFSFAKQRFDSTIDPGAKLALMLLPVATTQSERVPEPQHYPGWAPPSTTQSERVPEPLVDGHKSYIDSKPSKGAAPPPGPRIPAGCRPSLLLKEYDGKYHVMELTHARLPAHMKPTLPEPPLPAARRDHGSFMAQPWRRLDAAMAATALRHGPAMARP
jgi:hypothetical protein